MLSIDLPWRSGQKSTLSDGDEQALRERRAVVANKIVETQVTDPIGGGTGNVYEVKKAVVRALLLHMTSPNMRTDLWNALFHLNRRSVRDLDPAGMDQARLETRPPLEILDELREREDFHAWGERDSHDHMIDAETLIWLFTFIRFPPFTVTPASKNVVWGRAVSESAEIDTRVFSAFWQAIVTMFPEIETRYMLLLFFVHTNLMKKNGKEIVDQAPLELSAVDREALWSHMQSTDPRLGQPTVSDEAFDMEQSYMNAWKNLLRRALIVDTDNRGGKANRSITEHELLPSVHAHTVMPDTASSSTEEEAAAAAPASEETPAAAASTTTTVSTPPMAVHADAVAPVPPPRELSEQQMEKEAAAAVATPAEPVPAASSIGCALHDRSDHTNKTLLCVGCCMKKRHGHRTKAVESQISQIRANPIMLYARNRVDSKIGTEHLLAAVISEIVVPKKAPSMRQLLAADMQSRDGMLIPVGTDLQLNKCEAFSDPDRMYSLVCATFGQSSVRMDDVEKFDEKVSSSGNDKRQYSNGEKTVRFVCAHLPNEQQSLTMWRRAGWPLNSATKQCIATERTVPVQPRTQQALLYALPAV